MAETRGKGAPCGLALSQALDRMETRTLDGETRGGLVVEPAWCIHSLQDVEIHAAPSGAPEVFLFNHRAAVSLSLSHRGGKALCFVACSGTGLGCDLELVETRDDSFVADFFTTNERRLLDRAPTGEGGLS